jgi:iron(III) transport system ATP-binding protein
MLLLSCSHLSRGFDEGPLFEDVGFELFHGERVGLVGPNGVGKTTLLRLLAGFERADTGSIGIGGVLVDGPGAYLPPERRRIGYVPQEGSLFPHLTVAGNVGFGLPASQRRGGKVDTLLETVGLGGFGRRYPHQLSGGQQQRVALARALAIEPAVVLLDEPFASLDAHLRASVRADVQEIFRRAGTTAVLVTHDQDEALSVADRVAALCDGSIAQCAPPEDLYCRPADPRLASFIGEANLLEGVVSGATVKTLLGALPLDPAAAIPGAAGQVTVLIRPEQIDIVPNEDGLTAQVTSYRYHGHDAVLYAQPEDDAAASPVVVRITGGPHRPVGSGVTLRARGPVFAWPAD